MIGKILYYIILLPLSILPLRVLYVFSYLVYLFLYYILAYRKKVILINIQNSFPDLNENARKQIVKSFYKHFADILIEGIKNLSISKKNLENRVRLKNPQLIEQYYKNNQSVILTSGHYNNWEWLITIQDCLLPHQAVGIGMPLSRQSLDQKINSRRSRLGMIVTNSKNYKKCIEKLNKTPYALLIIGDQSPGNEKKSYWTTFLNQDTGFVFGTEMIANNYGLPVIYFTTTKIKRGYYELEFKLICDNPKALKYGEITEKYVNFLEKDILNEPSHWIWSHKRWKKRKPKDLEILKNDHETTFNNRFRSH